jgi:RNA-directed DNA polymerase
LTELISKKTPKQKKLRHAEYYNLTETFDKLYADSKQGKTFTKLYDLAVSEENILLAYRNMKRNKGSSTAGTDKRNIKDLEIIPREKFVELVKRKMAFYQPKPVKRVEIPKHDGKMRPLGIPTIMDRVVQQCILQVLEPICEAKFFERSNGFRPNRSAENALAQCYRMVQKQHLYYVVDVDIKGFFDNVNHTKLRQQMWELGIRDKRILSIITAMLKAPVILPNGDKLFPDKGTPQGGLCSPLLGNIVLNELDWWVASQWENIPTRHNYQTRIMKNGTVDRSPVIRALTTTNLKEMYIVRYADDFKIFCRSYEGAKRVFIAVRLWLKERLKLDISESKSKIINLKKNYSDFLGFKFKAVKKGNSYVVRSHMSDKALKREAEKLIDQVEEWKLPRIPRKGGSEFTITTAWCGAFIITINMQRISVRTVIDWQELFCRS